jgi:hypothetical protein
MIGPVSMSLLRFVRFRFSLKMLLLGVVVVSLAAYLLMMPTFRAQRFAQYVNTFDRESAMKMLTEGNRRADSLHRGTLDRSAEATIAPLTFSQLLHGQRRVTVNGFSRSRSQSMASYDPPTFGNPDWAEFIVHRSTITSGMHGMTTW